MFKTSMLMLAAVASVGVTLASSSAEARPASRAASGAELRSIARISGRILTRIAHVRWHRPWIYGVGAAAVAAPAYAAVAPRPAAAAPGPCTCLTKEYTQDKLVVFTDRCTKEMAAAPIGGPQQGAGPAATGARRGRADQVNVWGTSRAPPWRIVHPARTPAAAGVLSVSGIKLLYRVAFRH